MTLHFTIPGHPVGYMRTTQAGCKFDRQYKRYQAYKDRVVAAFLNQCPGTWGSPKPLTTTPDKKTQVSLKIYFKNRVHCDPDNCFKAVADALFTTDKYVYGDFDFAYDPINPRVEVILR
jgi:Holliday junction resolvase RusA-like endonuclease